MALRTNQPPTPRGSTRVATPVAMALAYLAEDESGILGRVDTAAEATHTFIRDPVTGFLTTARIEFVGASRLLRIAGRLIPMVAPDLAGLELDPVTFEADFAGVNPDPVLVPVASVNDTPLVGLSVGDTPAWLSATLDAPDAPATLTLAVDLSEIDGPGTYAARVRIDSDSAAPAWLAVTLDAYTTAVALGALTFARSTVATEARSA